MVARLDNPDIHLAAYSGIVFPLALVIESPIIMLLTAATALGRDLNSYHNSGGSPIYSASPPALHMSWRLRRYTIGSLDR